MRDGTVGRVLGAAVMAAALSVPGSLRAADAPSIEACTKYAEADYEFTASREAVAREFAPHEENERRLRQAAQNTLSAAREAADGPRIAARQAAEGPRNAARQVAGEKRDAARQAAGEKRDAARQAAGATYRESNRKTEFACSTTLAAAERKRSLGLGTATEVLRDTLEAGGREIYGDAAVTAAEVQVFGTANPGSEAKAAASPSWLPYVAPGFLGGMDQTSFLGEMAKVADEIIREEIFASLRAKAEAEEQPIPGYLPPVRFPQSAENASTARKAAFAKLTNSAGKKWATATARTESAYKATIAEVQSDCKTQSARTESAYQAETARAESAYKASVGEAESAFAARNREIDASGAPYRAERAAAVREVEAERAGTYRAIYEDDKPFGFILRVLGMQGEVTAVKARLMQVHRAYCLNVHGM